MAKCKALVGSAVKGLKRDCKGQACKTAEVFLLYHKVLCFCLYTVVSIHTSS